MHQRVEEAAGRFAHGSRLGWAQTRQAAFLVGKGVAVDTTTPAGVQVAVGPQHLVLFRRAGDGAFRLHTPLAISGSFRLEDESGRTVFSGAAAELRERGVELSLARWRAAILRIRR